jgi:uncharacterized membrane protein YhaH (DUF805 family)
MLLMRYLFSFQGRLARAEYWRRFWRVAIASCVVVIAVFLLQPPFWILVGAI